MKVHPLAMEKKDEKQGPDAPAASKFEPTEFTLCEHAVCAFMGLVTLPCFCFHCQTLLDYERGVLLRHGRRVHEGTLGGGMHYLIPSVDSVMKIDIREKLIDIPRQEVVTKEGLNLIVDGVVYYKVFDASRALLEVENVTNSITLIAQTKLREILALHNYEEIQTQRLTLARRLKKILDDASEPWGVDINRVELTDLRLPPALQQAMNGEMEAKRRAVADMVTANSRREIAMVNATGQKEASIIHAQGVAQAKVIRANSLAQAKLLEAEGDRKAAENFKNAAQKMAEAPLTVQLRYLNTLNDLGKSDKNSMMIPFGADSLEKLLGH
jgi:regulator of protease activity HflC (stomatin/prohibitin superfamily)